ncbi:MAG: hypothetical protein KC543_02435 [Myxococcales bacterium]|nr:hypothetical protein [Myxococcales bacterium]
MFHRVLIASRGDAAHRVARTCRQRGVVSIGLRPDSTGDTAGDARTPCDETVAVSADPRLPAPPEVIIDAARRARADAVHPGYASPDGHVPLARALEAADLPFIGADPDAAELATNRASLREAVTRARARMPEAAASVSSTLAEALGAAEALGYPVALWPTDLDAPRPVGPLSNPAALEDAWAAVERGGHAPALVEQTIARPRILHVWILADGHGAVAPLCETERSVRIDGQTALEECPSPELSIRSDGETIRSAAFDVATRVAEELHCTGLITVELLLDVDRRLWVSQVSLGLPRLHAACERVTGVDLVALQLELGAGEPIPPSVLAVQPSGHAFEVALLAARGSDLDAPMARVHFPPAPHRSVRVVPTVAAGARVPLDDRPLLARVSTFAPIRHQAMLWLDRILAEHSFAPVASNAPMLRKILADHAFRAGQYDGSFFDRHILRKRGI